MKQEKFYTRDSNGNIKEIDNNIANNVLKQYFERRFVSVIGLSCFVIGFLLGVIAHAL